MGELTNKVWTFMSGGTTQIILGAMAIFSPILIWILMKMLQHYKNKQAYNDSKDEQFKDAGDGIKDNLSKDGAAADSAVTNDNWAEEARKKKEESNGKS